MKITEYSNSSLHSPALMNNLEIEIYIIELVTFTVWYLSLRAGWFETLFSKSGVCSLVCTALQGCSNCSRTDRYERKTKKCVNRSHCVEQSKQCFESESYNRSAAISQVPTALNIMFQTTCTYSASMSCQTSTDTNWNLPAVSKCWENIS